MTLIEIVIDILEKAVKPLKQGEIWDILVKHDEYENCQEIKRVKVPTSALARCLTKYTSGSQAIIGFNGNEHSSKSYFLISNNLNTSFQKNFSEFELHPFLAEFAKYRFGSYCKTINAVKIKQKNNQINRWANPDIVGINPVILSLNPLFQEEVQKLGILSSRVARFYSFELKLKIDKSNLTQNYFQAVSNSSWANFGYLVVLEMDIDPNFINSILRLNQGYGIGIIKLNPNYPKNSEIVVPAREKEIVDIDFMNFLVSLNQDFYNFIDESRKIIFDKNINIPFFDFYSQNSI